MPTDGTIHGVAVSKAATGVRRNGETLFLDPGLLRVASLRSQTAVRFVVPAETLEALALARVSVTVHRLATLIPRADASDPEPQTEDDIALAVEQVQNTAANPNSVSMRRGLGPIHDQYMRSLNFRYWDALEPQS